jgi:hypothetical protein
LGSYFQRILPLLFKSSANTVLGNGVVRYMTSPITSGEPSWPRSTPVEKVQTGCRFFTFCVLIWLSVLYRWLA